MVDVDITSLSVEISAESQGAELNLDKLTTAISKLRTKGNVAKVIDGLDKLTNSLTALKSAQGDFSGLEKVTSFIEGITKLNANDSAKSINTLSKSIQKIPDALSGIGDYSDALDSLRDVTDSFNSLSAIQAPKGLSSTINALKKIPDTMSGMDSVNSDLTQTKAILASFNTLPTVTAPDGLTKMVNTLRRIPTVIAETNKADYKGLGDNIREIMNALAPLSLLDISGLKGLSSAFTALNKVPDLSEKLKAADLTSFKESCVQISDALAPLASQLEKVGNAFAKLPPQLSKVVTQANRVTAANERQKKSYMSLSSQMNSFMRNMAKLVSLKAIATYLGNAAEKFNSYYEAANLFGVSMKGLTGEASTFINKMETLLGIDPTEAMNNMATIQGLTTSFGMASDKAYILSKNLTQLGYDLASLKNIPVAESFTKIQAAISGELEPIRRLGVDLSQARLQQELLNLGYSQSVSSLSQADKAVLRYIAIMKQTTDAQGDFARTLSSPANMIRILQAQLNSLARSVGSLLYPALKSILPPLIAAVELVKELVTGIASLMGVKVEFPDFSSASDAVSGVTDAMDDTTKATGKAAKAFKNYIMGFDELNVIQKNADSSGGSGSGSGAAGNLLGDVDLSGYDMFKQYNEEFAKQIDSLKQKIKEMLPVIGAVTAALALWKLTTFIADVVDAIKKIGILKGMVAGGILIGIGFFLMFDGIKKAIEDKLNAINFTEILVGAITFVGGAALLGSKIAEFITTSFADSAVAKAITAAGGKMGGALVGAVVAGVVAGVAMFVTGVYDALTNGLNILNGLLIPAGSTMAGAAVGAIIGSLGGPIGAGIGAIIGLIVGGLTDAGIAIYQNWDKITAALDKVNADLKQWFVGVGVWWDEKWKGFKTNWDKAWNSLADTLKELRKKFIEHGKNLVQGLVDGINKGIETARNAVGGLAKAILDKFTTDTGIHSPSKVFKGYGGYIVEGLANGISAAKDLAVNAIQSVSDAVKTVGSQLASENYGLGNANVIVTADGDESNLEKTAMSLRNVLSNVGGGLTDWLKKIKSAFTDFSDGINAVSDVGKKISDGFNNTVDQLSKAANSIVSVRDSFDKTVSGIKSFLSSTVSNAENSYNFSGGGLKGTLSAIGSVLINVFDAIPGFTSNLNSIIAAVETAFSAIQKVVPILGQGKDFIVGIVSANPKLAMIAAIVAAIASAFVMAWNSSEKLRDSITSLFAEVKKAATDLYENLKEAFAPVGESIKSMIDSIGKLLNTVFDSIGTILSSIIDLLTPIISALGKILVPIITTMAKIISSVLSVVAQILGVVAEALSPVVEFIAQVLSTVFSILGDIISAVVDFLQPAIDLVGYAVEGIGTVLKGILSVFAGIINGMISGVEAFVNVWVKGINLIIGALNKISINIPDWIPGIGGKKFGFNITEVKEVTLPRIKTFADGGFPDEGQIFIARESGTEMVGNMGGHTAVANNDQIVDGIREGVESAMTKQNELLRQQNELLKALLEKESTSEISVSSISQAISRVNQRNGKTIIPIGT